MMEKLIKLLDYNKIKINWNKNPIEMDLFLNFLTVKTDISRNHLGSDNGWTKRFNNDVGLIIHGGIVSGCNYLDAIEYGTKLSNGFNNIVSPFYIFDILNEDGKKFFIDYYKEDIEEIKKQKLNNNRNLRIKIKENNSLIKEIENIINN